MQIYKVVTAGYVIPGYILEYMGCHSKINIFTVHGNVFDDFESNIQKTEKRTNETYSKVKI